MFFHFKDEKLAKRANLSKKNNFTRYKTDKGDPSLTHSQIRWPASALLDKLLCLLGPGGPVDSSSSSIC